jgi:hypothetical protein
MAQAAPAVVKIPTKSPQPVRSKPGRATGQGAKAGRPAPGERQQCEAASEGKLAARLEKVTERLQAGAPNDPART